MTVVDEYQAQTDTLATSTVAQVAAVYAAWQAGQLARDEAVQLIVSVINLANATATSLADAYIAVQIETAAGVATPTLGIPPIDDTDRLTKAVETILDELPHAPIPPVEPGVSDQHDSAQTPDAPADPMQQAGLRFERLARAEPLETAQKASSDAIAQQPMVEGWTRQMDADPCQLCRWWWREGRIWPKDHPFQSHKGCNCQPKVVLAESIQSTQFTRRLERNAR